MAAHLPPVGNSITTQLVEHSAEMLGEVFSGFDVFLYRSGTMALAASLVAVAASARDRGLKGVPEVLIPAYACPDLVSAVVYAGLKPVLVDFEADRPWMDLEMLRQHLSRPQTVAVIAVHFLGIPERLGQIREVIAGRDIVLIEDSAQYFPCKGVTTPHWFGDLIVLSFGRGKPVSLLGGGAVLCRKGMQGLNLVQALPLAAEAALAPDNTVPGLSRRLKIALYHQLLRPGFYGLLQALPFLHIGETRYKPLSAIMAAEAGSAALLAANIAQYQPRDRCQQAWVAELIAQLGSDQVIDLPVVSGCDAAEPLLRYPVLLSSGQSRDQLLAHLQAQGLGASSMYPAILPQLPGLSALLAGQGRFPNAERFASTLLTLPTHIGVGLSDINRMADVFEAGL